jgi:gliding motility-associated lipoprotein GldH
MANYKIYLLGLILLITGACQRRTVYRDFKEFKNYTWNKTDEFSFNIPIKQDKLTANISLAIRHVGEYPFDDLPLAAILTTPGGEVITVEKVINLKNENGEFKGDVAGNLYDVDEILWKEYNFDSPGTYIIKLRNIMPRERIPGLVDIGIIVELP